jgi:MFS family permease
MRRVLTKKLRTNLQGSHLAPPYNQSGPCVAWNGEVASKLRKEVLSCRTCPLSAYRGDNPRSVHPTDAATRPSACRCFCKHEKRKDKRVAHSLVSQQETSLFTNRNYRLLWSGQSLSLIGDYFFSATLTLWIITSLAQGASWLPLATGAVALSMVVPSLLIGPLAGVWVDRWDRRWTMLWTDTARLVLVTLFLLLVLLVSDHTILMLGCLVALMLVASGQQFFLPARAAVVADLVPAEQHPAAYGSLQQASYLAQIVGPAGAAPLYVALGPTWAITLDILSFLVSCLLLGLIRIPTEHQSERQEPLGFWREFVEGLRFFVRNRVLVTLLLSGMLFMLGGMAYNALEYLYGSENLHIPNTLLGLYVACAGVGVVLGLPLMAALAKRFGEVEVLWLCLIGHGLTMLALSRATTMLPGILCGLVLGVTNASVFVTVRPLTVLVTPRTLIGRVMAVEGPLITIASLVGGLLAGILASTVFAHLHATLAGMSFGTLDSILVLAGFVLVGSGVFARLTLYRAVKELRGPKKGLVHQEK